MSKDIKRERLPERLAKPDRTAGDRKTDRKPRRDDRTFPQPANGGGILSPGTGRPPGATNYVTRQLKAGILDAAARVGFDGKGADGLVGYLQRLAVYEPATFGSLLRRILPVQMKAELDPNGVTARMLAIIQAQKAELANGSGAIDITPSRSYASDEPDPDRYR